jgi:DNA (cytosine-5)-methyltransferase 1
VLPEFPEFTHSPNGENGLKPYVSVNSVLNNISPESPDHNPDEVIKRAFGPWDASSILPKCITTSGGQNWHPSGLRDLTNRELAALQGFPNDHIFGRTCQTSVKKQIGNGVPPCVSKVLFEWIRKHLEKVDGVDLEAEAIIID